MKKRNLTISSETFGGWSYSQHLGCALMGATLGGGIGSAFMYTGCLLTLENKPFGQW